MVINIQTSQGACTLLDRTLRCASQVPLAREGSANAVQDIYSKVTHPHHKHDHSQTCQPAATVRLHLRVTAYDSHSTTRHTQIAPASWWIRYRPISM